MSAWSLDIFLCVFQSPEGRTENSPGLEAWEGSRKENRPERAADFRALFSRDILHQDRLDGILETTNLFWYKNLRAQLGAKETGPIKCNNNMSVRCGPLPCSDALSGRFHYACGSQAEALGYSLIALRATAKCPNSRPSAPCASNAIGEIMDCEK